MGTRDSIRAYILDWMLIVFGVSITLVFSIWKPSAISESHGTWFQRSGAISVLCSLLVEFRITHRALYATFLSNDKTHNITLSQRIDNWNSKGYPIACLHRLALCLATVGTVIWAYGDLLYDLVQKTN